MLILPKKLDVVNTVKYGFMVYIYAPTFGSVT